MPLEPGRRIGPFEVEALVGVGGMGEVYRARDTKLGRAVALKVLPGSFAADPERRARFEREARTLAALNHPNIAAIHGFEDDSALSALVLEYVDGPTLADRIAEGPLPLDDVLSIARQIAEALETAHEQNIIHRDLKPANIKLRGDGTVKVLDFGLARLVDPAAPSSSDVSASPTITSPAMTAAGVILGTAAYMSPEQARGKAVDRRGDIWAFGLVLYEMLTGRRAFEGDDVSITIAGILKDPVDWSALPADTPAPLRRVLRRCLEKNPRQRLSSIGDARLELDDAAAPQPDHTHAPTRDRWSRILPWAIAGVALLAAGALLVGRADPSPIDRQPKVTFDLDLPTEQTGAAVIALSPDGKTLVARVFESEGAKLWLRPLDQLAGRYLEGVTDAIYPFWSPDSRSIGYFTSDRLRVVELPSGSSRVVAEVTQAVGGAWSRDGEILFAPATTGPLHRVSASGGPVAPVTILNPSVGELSHRHPMFLPDGRHFVFLVVNTNASASAIHIGSLDSTTTKPLVTTTSQPIVFAPDWLLYARDTALVAQRFDLRTMEMIGAASEVLPAVMANPATGSLAVKLSDNGVLAYRRGSGNHRVLTWIDRSGRVGARVGNPDLYENPRLSPDGTRLAVFRQEPAADIWILDLERGGSTRLTNHAATDTNPIWSPDGSRIAFVSNREGTFNIYLKSSGGVDQTENLLHQSPFNKRLNDWSSDGRYILYEETDPNGSTDVWLLPLQGDRTPRRLLGTRFLENRATFSPDGRWIAYGSNESGDPQVYVQAFPDTGRKWHVSSNLRSAVGPRWRPDGKELYFDSSGRMMGVDLTGTMPGQELRAAAPRQLFRGLMNLPPHSFDIAPSGDRFLIVTLAERIEQGTTSAQPVTIETQWQPPRPRPSQ